MPITAQVTVPHGVRVRTLWLGISTADRSAGGPAGPTGWAAVLLRITKPLTRGQRTFRLHWTAPGALRPANKVYLIAYWVAGRSAPEPIIDPLCAPASSNTTPTTNRNPTDVFSASLP